ncbi:hypothetical protein E3N88_29092 [Mikania micrantha]|uniref:Uncharacterized protein n=1 Tax=Mikania micrantha TaxID=192012 RepID=A0A5N6N1Y0_9ASTR|nr:hypothetical protein E3N88_29092 [Mikania micrantha]
MIAPRIPPSTTPPATMLSKKLFSDGVTPDAACATSGTTMDAVRTAAVKAVTVFSLMELLMTKRLEGAACRVFEDESVKGLKKEFVGGRVVLWVNGIAMEATDVEAILLMFCEDRNETRSEWKTVAKLMEASPRRSNHSQHHLRSIPLSRSSFPQNRPPPPRREPPLLLATTITTAHLTPKALDLDLDPAISSLDQRNLHLEDHRRCTLVGVLWLIQWQVPEQPRPPAHVTESENAREVNPPTIHVDEAFEGERYDEEDPDYDTEGSEAGNEEMFTLWIVLAILMADVMPRGHGGDGDDDPTPPGGYRRGVHEDDVEPPRRKTRGKAKNIKLMRAVSTNKGPLEVPFDTEATFTPVGERNDWFTREIGIYMQANIAFEKKSWGNVSDHEKNALYEHLRESFDLNAVERDLEAAKKKGGIEGAIMKRYRDRKARAKQHFLSVGGEADLVRARANPPEDMPEQNWWRAIDYFTSDGHKSRSRVNTSVRQQQKYTNRGGTSSYSSFCYKLEKSRLDAFYNAHTYKDGTFDSPLAQDHYDRLKSAFDSRTEPNTDGEHDAGSSTHMNDVEVFEEVMGQRRGHYRGIGPKPTGAASPASVGYSGHSQRQPRFTKEDYQEMFQDPNFRDELTQFLGSMNPSDKGNDGYNDEDDDDDE